MKKQRLFIGMILFLVPLTLTGCGISQELYDSVVSEVSKTQQELQSVITELEIAQSKVSELTSSLETTQAKNSELTSNLEKMEAKLEATKVELEATKDKSSELTLSLEKSQNEYSSFKSEAERLFILLDSSLALNHAILGANAGIMLEDLDNTEKACLAINSKLTTLKDVKLSEFQALWEESYVTQDGQWALYYQPFERFMLLHAQRINSKATWLREHLLQ